MSRISSLDDLTPLLPKLIDAFTGLWSVDSDTLTVSQNYVVFDVFFEGLPEKSAPTDVCPLQTDVYAVEQADDLDVENSLTIDDGETVLIKGAVAKAHQDQDDPPLLVISRLGAGTLLEALVVFLNASVECSTEGDSDFSDLLVRGVDVKDAYADFMDSKRTESKLTQTFEELNLATIDDVHIRTVLQYVLAPLYVRTRFSNTGLETDIDLLSEIQEQDDAERMLDWLDWGRILGEITGETDTGGRTFLVRID